MKNKQTFDFHVEGVSAFMQKVAEGLCMPGAHVPPSTKDKTLGDRSKYVGASSATGCLYKAYRDVIEKASVDSKQIFVFERGHQLEEMIRKGLNGLGWIEIDSIDKHRHGAKSVVHQEEVCGIGEYGFIKAHVDFVFISSKELVIKEIKSSATLPLSPYLSHIYQVQLQMWLLKNKYPDKKVRASVVYHNWDTGESIDYPIEANDALLGVALDQAQTLWKSLQQQVAPKPTTQLYCSKCAYKGSCPALCFGAETDLPEDLIELASRLSDYKSADKSMKKLKENFKALLISAGLKKAVIGENILEIVNGQYGPYLKVI
jgi:CRISPR-associated exonuclease Cas4